MEIDLWYWLEEFNFTKIVYETAGRIDLCIIYSYNTSKYIHILNLRNVHNTQIFCDDVNI